MKIAVWNVNGLRACMGKGFAAWLERTQPALLGLQEVRALPEDFDAGAGNPKVMPPKGWKMAWNPAEKKGYSGTALLYKKAPAKVVTGLGIPEFDREGRLVIAELDGWAFLNGYFPKGSGSERDNSRVPYKLAFYEAVLARAEQYRSQGFGVAIAGDFNTAHTPLDLANWKSNQKTSGFLPEERAMIDRYLAAGYVDVFRARHPDETGHYTWWSQRMGARARNVGWRIDYFLVSQELAPRVKKAWIEPEVLGSDHCPVWIELGPAASRSSARA
jgi:exodeoxyribonuclease-3